MQTPKFYKTESEWIEVWQHLYPDTDIYLDKYKQGTELYEFIECKSATLEFFDKKWQTIYEDSFIISASDKALIRWENDLHLPDAIFDETKDIEIRRRQCLIKQWIAEYGIRQPKDFYAIANFLGFPDIKIEFSGKNYSALTLPFTMPAILFGDSAQEAFTWIVRLPTSYSNLFTLPFTMPAILNFSTGSLEKLKLLFKKVRPQYVELIYRYDL